MKTRYLSIMLVLFLFSWGMSACSSQEASVSPRAWFDAPTEGKALPAGKSITIVSHGYAPDGIAEMLLSVNGEAYHRDAPLKSNKDFSEFRQEWLPAQPGTYILQIRPYDVNGQSGAPVSRVVRVVESVAEGPSSSTPAPAPEPTATETATPRPASTATSTPTATPEPPTATPTSTPTPVPPTPTPTPVPPTPTPTPVPPTPTPTPVPPTPTPTPIPQDTTPPPAPTLMVPEDGLTLSCRAEQNLVWLPVSDPSGIAGYYLQVERETKIGQWDEVNHWGPIHDKQFKIDVQCGIHYRWRVRAKDGAGNFGKWSALSYFSINLE